VPGRAAQQSKQDAADDYCCIENLLNSSNGNCHVVGSATLYDIGADGVAMSTPAS
jgi:hypothetical protein